MTLSDRLVCLAFVLDQLPCKRWGVNSDAGSGSHGGLQSANDGEADVGCSLSGVRRRESTSQVRSRSYRGSKQHSCQLVVRELVEAFM